MPTCRQAAGRCVPFWDSGSRKNEKMKKISNSALKDKLAWTIGIILFLTSCSPKLTSTMLKSYPPLNYQKEVRVFTINEPVPSSAERLGTIKIGDSGFSINCNYAKVIEIAKDEARKVGGNVIKITQHRVPDLVSTCHRITADIMKLDSIDNRIAITQQIDNSKSEFISKGRKLLLDKFQENDMEGVKEMKNYLINEVEDLYYAAFYRSEYLLILYWTREYDELLKIISRVTPYIPEFSVHPSIFYTSFYTRYDARTYPPSDMFSARLKSRSERGISTIINQIESADFSSEDKEFLKINFESLIMRNESSQERINVLADNFLKAYPESKFNDYVKKNVKYKLVLHNWGIAIEIFSGGLFFTGGLSESFRNAIPLGVAMDISYKKFELFFRIPNGFGKSREDIVYPVGIYKKGSPIETIFPEASFGYAIFDEDELKLSPFIGVGGMYIAPPSRKNKTEPKMEDFSSTCAVFGINLDIKFGKKGSSFRPKSVYGFLRIRYGFYSAFFEKKNDNLFGNAHYLSVGLGINVKGVRREY
jgi:hypothetical protein